MADRHVVLRVPMNPTRKDLERFHERVGTVSDKFPVRTIVGILVSGPNISKKRLQQAANWLNAYNPCPYSTYIVQQTLTRTRRGRSYHSKLRNGSVNNRATRRDKRKYRGAGQESLSRRIDMKE